MLQKLAPHQPGTWYLIPNTHSQIGQQ